MFYIILASKWKYHDMLHYLDFVAYPDGKGITYIQIPCISFAMYAYVFMPSEVVS